MNLIDIFILICVIFGAYKGFKRGFLVEVAILIGLVFGIFLAAIGTDVLARILSGLVNWNLVLLRIIAFLTIFVIVMVVITVGCQKEKVDVNSADIVAKVGEQVISKDVYDKHLILFKKNYEDMYGDKVWSLDVGGKTFLQAVQENVLEKLINDAAIISYMKNNKIEIEASEIEEIYAELS